LYNRILDIVTNYRINQISNQIPKSLKKSNGDVDISKFNKRGPLFPRGSRSLIGPLGYQILKDLDGHKGSAWKLLNAAGTRIASLSASGRVVGK
jgi:hypothetical protein